MGSWDIRKLVPVHPNDLFDDENKERECWDISHLVSGHLEDLLGDENKEEEILQREQEKWFALRKITLKLILIYYEEIDMEPVMFHSQSKARWDDDAHIKFIELCEQEIRKGNRPSTHLSKDGWKNMVNKFNKKMGRNYDRKQMKNHWYNMKAEWTLFKQMIRGETDLGWDATKNTIIADDDWWKRKMRMLDVKNLGTKIFR
ncbi:L10-interacting MYB domain-containing protein-like [Lycium barbarum]|uniref:L10-interacting MYB domain-containing protein-like n=1 Tax=Lycium barbarum TaxID=112863 RepID=UPI00293F4E84|nr:L10-interacting MYB domain-containing protein-like [Lycium barbarum]XP_060209258.1 L10-interacting MYB domain-containing protein-like [Lycium barbarum]